KLLDAGYVQSSIDDCVFYKGASEEQLVQEIKLLQSLKLDIEDQGHPSDYVGVNIQHHKDGSYKFTQQVLINTILDDVGLKPSYKRKPIPMKSSKYLSHHIDSTPFYNCDSFQFNFRSIVGKLNYLAQTSRPDIIFAVHQLARYSADPSEDHGKAVEWLAMYLNHTKTLGVIFRVNPKAGFECYADADFAGAFQSEFSQQDPACAKSRSGWYIMYTGCPIVWASKLQTLVALSTTEAEYIALSSALRDIIPIMQLIDEMKGKGFQVL
ncbi:hypothetical protein ACHAXS_000067, partial [Conticribra weissflogii]